MQSTAVPPALATLRAAFAETTPTSASQVGDLLTIFATVPDPRRPQGTCFPLAALLLTLAVTALLANHLSVLAIAEWGKAQSCDLLERLGFPQGVTPHQATVHRLFRKLDPMTLTKALASSTTAPAGEVTPSPPHPRGSQGVAIDGKVQHGRLRFAHDPTPVHAISAVVHGTGSVLAQLPVTVQGDKVEAEQTVAPSLIARLDWHGRVFTGDALYCQRQLCEQVLAAGGDYLILVKDNQPTLHDDLRHLFDPPHRTLPLSDQREAQSYDNGHGRHREVRHLVASTDLNAYLEWPGLAQGWRWERRWQEQDPAKREVRYGITSLPPAVADAARLLELKRGHWTIENDLHYVKDITFGDDQSLIQVGTGPMVLAVLRDTALTLLPQAGVTRIASRLRYHSSHPELAVALVRAQNA
jgi:predicted transposase YbfD/YdcC